MFLKSIVLVVDWVRLSSWLNWLNPKKVGDAILLQSEKAAVTHVFTAGGSNLRHGREGSSCTRGLGGQAALLGTEQIGEGNNYIVWRCLEGNIPILRWLELVIHFFLGLDKVEFSSMGG